MVTLPPALCRTLFVASGHVTPPSVHVSLPPRVQGQNLQKIKEKQARAATPKWRPPAEVIRLLALQNLRKKEEKQGGDN